MTDRPYSYLILITSYDKMKGLYVHEAIVTLAESIFRCPKPATSKNQRRVYSSTQLSLVGLKRMPEVTIAYQNETYAKP